MSVYPFKALSVNYKELVSFTLEDGPWRQNMNFFGLMNRPGSPILRYNTIMRGCDIPGLFEGDIIEYKGKKYIMRYELGLAAVSLDGEVIPSSKLEYINVVDNMYFQKEFPITYCNKLVFKYIEKEDEKYKENYKYFGIKSITGSFKDKALISIYGSKLVNVNDVLPFTGIRYKGERIHLGECIEGNPVYMEKGRLLIKALGGCHDVKSSPILLQLAGKWRYNENV